jgi:hypothetical protein
MEQLASNRVIGTLSSLNLRNNNLLQNTDIGIQPYAQYHNTQQIYNYGGSGNNFGKIQSGIDSGLSFPSSPAQQGYRSVPSLPSSPANNQLNYLLDQYGLKVLQAPNALLATLKYNSPPNEVPFSSELYPQVDQLRKNFGQETQEQTRRRIDNLEAEMLARQKMEMMRRLNQDYYFVGSTSPQPSPTYSSYVRSPSVPNSVCACLGSCRPSMGSLLPYSP